MAVEPFTRIHQHDLELLNIGLAALEPGEADGEAVWLRTFEHGRQWIMESSAGVFFFQANEHTTVPDEYGFIPISDRVRRFCELTDNEYYELSIADGTTLVVDGGALSMAVDFVATPNNQPVPWSLDEIASMVVPVKAFTDLLGAARVMPSGIREFNHPSPPLWLQISNESVGLHVDWTEFGASKATYRLATERQSGNITVSLPHRLMENALRVAPAWIDLDDEPVQVTLTVGTVGDGDDARSAVSLATDSWHLLLWINDPLEERWATNVDTALEPSDITVLYRVDTEWGVALHGQELRVTLHHGHPDVARVSIPLLNNAEESIELFRELSQLNAASNGVRYWFVDEVVWAACDIPASTIDTQLVPTIQRVVSAAVLYRPMVAVLALGTCS